MLMVREEKIRLCCNKENEGEYRRKESSKSERLQLFEQIGLTKQ
jgi:hypothetical protein